MKVENHQYEGHMDGGGDELSSAPRAVRNEQHAHVP